MRGRERPGRAARPAKNPPINKDEPAKLLMDRAKPEGPRRGPHISKRTRRDLEELQDHAKKQPVNKD